MSFICLGVAVAGLVTLAGVPSLRPLMFRRIAALRAAFAATVTEPEIVPEAKHLGIEIAPMSGPAIEALLKQLYAAPKAIVAKTAQTMSPSQ